MNWFDLEDEDEADDPAVRQSKLRATLTPAQWAAYQRYLREHEDELRKLRKDS